LTLFWHKLRMRYPSDLTDEQWNLLRPLLPARPKTGRPPTDRRLLVDGVLYLLRAGCAWRMLPKDFGPWSTVYGVYHQWVKEGRWQHFHDCLRTKVRQTEGRQPSPTAAILDSQTVKIGDQCGVRGYDAGKKTSGRKRHILVDVLGLLLAVYVGSADEQDRDGARTLLGRCIYWYGRLAKIWADAGYAGTLVAWVKALHPRGRLHLDIVRRDEDAKGFVVLHRRWLVERTFGWFMKQRRLVRDYETKTEHSEAMLHISMISLMLRRLARSAAH
jgi:putative transposase